MKHYYAAAVCLTAVTLFAACSQEPRTDGKNGREHPAVLKGATIETVTSSVLPDSFEATGTVRSRTRAMVSARLPGTVSIIKFREGDRVRKGQLLMQLEAQENQANAAGSAAAIDEARRSLDEALARKRLAEATFERFRKLFSEQAVTRQEFDIRQTERDIAEQGVARAEARLKQAEEGARASSAIADYTKITAPLSGVITARTADLGTTVFPGQPLMTIEDENDYQLELAIPESLFSGVTAGAQVQIAIDALNSSGKAIITEVVPAADTASRTFTAKVRLALPGLKSGMFGRAAIRTGTESRGILIPKNALVERGTLSAVWTVTRDNLARMRLVKTGKTLNGRIEILAGLADAERIIVNGLENVSEGARVE